jgi:hypothetical protein
MELARNGFQLSAISVQLSLVWLTAEKRWLTAV